MDIVATHRMRPKDKMETLSAYYHVPICMIMRANSMTNAEQAFFCKEIKIPRRCYCNRCLGESAFKFITYTVGQEDSVYSIAKKHGVTMNIILKTNCIDDINNINAGDKLRIPVIKGELYSVRAGESLEDIAKSHGIETQRIKQMNCLNKRGEVYPGMQLLIG